MSDRAKRLGRVLRSRAVEGRLAFDLGGRLRRALETTIARGGRACIFAAVVTGWALGASSGTCSAEARTHVLSKTLLTSLRDPLTSAISPRA